MSSASRGVVRTTFGLSTVKSFFARSKLWSSYVPIILGSDSSSSMAWFCAIRSGTVARKRFFPMMKDVLFSMYILR